MAKLSDDTGFNNILDMARNETNWTKSHVFADVREYSTYLTRIKLQPLISLRIFYSIRKMISEEKHLN